MKRFGTLVLLRILIVAGWVTRAVPYLQGKDGEKHHVHSALNPSFVAESRVSGKSVDGKD